MSLRTKQLFVTLLCFLPLLVFVLVFSRVAYRSAKREGLANMKSSLDSVYDSIKNETDMIYRNMIVILRNADIRTLLQSELTKEERQTVVLTKRQAVSFVRILEEVSYIDSTEIYLDRDRAFLVDQDLFRDFGEVRDQGWCTDFLSGSEKGRWVALVSPDSGDPEAESVRPEALFYLTRVVNASDYTKTEAMIRIGYSEEHAAQLLSYMLLSPESSACLLDGDGNVILRRGKSEGFREDLLRDAGLREDGFSESGNGRYHYYFRTLPETGWKLLSCVPDSSFRASDHLQDYIPMLLAVILSWSVLLLLSTLYSGSMVRKIQKISDYVSAIESEHEVRLIRPFRAKDEIQTLADSYNSMAEALKKNLEREYLLGLSKRNSDLKALQAQINPHFLYNTLELIDYYAYENQPEIVEKIVKSLADFYKLSLNNGSDLYSLWKEIRLITSYFDIQKIRWESSIELVTDIPDELAQCQIPPFTLQPLIENAVLHGIRGNAEHRGKVTVSARKEGDEVIVSVEDDGIGMQQELVEELNREMELISEDTVSGSHYGIQNSNQRLKIIFGPKYGMRISSTENEGTLVQITIPAS